MRLKKSEHLAKPLFFAPLVPCVLKDSKLKSFDRSLLSVMIQLARKKGYCFATNYHLACVLNCSVGSVSKSINKMYKLGYIVNNYPNPVDGGRVFHRIMREDLFYKSEEIIPPKRYTY